MPINKGLIVNADDLGLSKSVNEAILFCYKKGYINSSSIITNTPFFDETAQLVQNNNVIINLGVHINFAEGKPITDFKYNEYLNNAGEWNWEKTRKYSNALSPEIKNAFLLELYAQIDKALAANLNITHIDSHYHLHILPSFYNLFIIAAKKYNLKLRLAQLSHEHNVIKYLYRLYINSKIKLNNHHYSKKFENLEEYLKLFPKNKDQNIELMVHPLFDDTGNLTDSVDAKGFNEWINHVSQDAYKLIV
ncbi:MAG: ChbG/HpnK family deacetylase [Pedobacter sp.]|nr:MAG: ChbG/HpnK family deacetylase [Pedobacter sp.]